MNCSFLYCWEVAKLADEMSFVMEIRCALTIPMYFVKVIIAFDSIHANHTILCEEEQEVLTSPASMKWQHHLKFVCILSFSSFLCLPTPSFAMYLSYPSNFFHSCPTFERWQVHSNGLPMEVKFGWVEISLVPSLIADNAKVGYWPTVRPIFNWYHIPIYGKVQRVYVKCGRIRHKYS